MKHIIIIFLLLFFPVVITGLVAQHTAIAASEEVTDENTKEDAEQEEESEDGSKKTAEQMKLDQALRDLGSSNPEAIEKSVQYFENMDETASIHLTRHLRNNRDDKRIRENAIYVIGRLGKKGEQAVPTLISFLRSEDADTRAVTAIALGKMGRGAKAAVDDLARLQFDGDKWVSQNAHKALVRIGTSKAKRIVRKFEELQDSKKGGK